MIHLLRLLPGLVVYMLLSQTVLQAQNHHLTYIESQQDFPNPERGFYIPISTSSARFVPLDSAKLALYRTQSQRVSKATYSINCSLVYRSYRLETFKSSPLSEDFLKKVSNDFAIAKKAGVKLILRFAYTEQATTGTCPDQYKICPPYGDAPKAIVLTHISQLSPLLHEHAAVIAVLQMGFIGIWGENYFTDYFGDASTNSLGVVPDSSWRDRNQVLAALLKALPKDRMVQVRTPQIKQRFAYGPKAPITSAAMNSGDGYTTSDLARIGFHNDCFLASADDYGTFYDVGNSSTKRGPATIPLRRYMAQDSRYTAVGGETCDDAFSPQNDCAPLGRAEEEMALMHYSYLNASYNNEVNNDWQTQGCMDNIRRRLGYRFVLRSATIPDHVKAGQRLQIDLILQNVGYSAPYNPRPFQLILRNTDNGAIHSITLKTDVRRLSPGSHQLRHTLQLPAALKAGRYELLLNLPDGYSSLAQNPNYSIRLANTDLWEDRTGYNNLKHTLIVGP
ncbi:DUF4832 domain-containing protein [Spirosoma pollinicola]|uniref:DUF4832 domain-containing protein n=1 Tax=Spirosoma pollinicola TaxID=2057025 RepID=A0A2K8Z1C8_9BACT|nr:DUF4832 domain-containing protein [Spirosoma pollinicola]AUD03677.1 hypothetical protein CWM47_18695 [Spirosoma pollinicola]